ncbi:putative IS4 family Transposase [Streptomyces viridochromogenes Tue57]|uniref:Putative IS4 family Transposase n=1 Tax=Streptomyces viridochromogenes Tue57 TaxID=1160705 RepID=L8PI73_STRVR|nr:putative IS4 family Transposase [Streptomyces viridochromogenes Tue57]
MLGTGQAGDSVSTARSRPLRREYKQRNTVERCINRLKQWRGLATRTDKLAIAYQAALHLAGILIWTRR